MGNDLNRRKNALYFLPWNLANRFETMKIVVTAALVLTLIAQARSVAAEKLVHGRVVDASGKPAAGVDVSSHWSANGPPHDENGKPYDRTTIDGQKAVWGNVGKMFPLSEKPAKTAPDGRFTITLLEGRHHLMAIDSDRRNGALVILANDEAPNIQIRLAPLVRIKGKIEGPDAGERPAWTHVWIEVPDDPARPLDFLRLGGCGSFDARFEISLPSGRYLIDPSWVTDDDEKLEMVPSKEIVLTGETAEIDLGVFRVTRSGPTLSTRVKQSKAAGVWNDYTEHYGEKPPPWNVADARGIKKDAKPADFRGKWILLDFWGVSCTPCIRNGMPKLMKFYEDHQSQRDRFEILAICIDMEGELKSIADLDKKLEPIIKHVWKKPLPFPVLLDPTFKTWERYGLPGLGTVVLIDPEGNLVEGDETALAEKLARP